MCWAPATVKVIKPAKSLFKQQSVLLILLLLRGNLIITFFDEYIFVHVSKKTNTKQVTIPLDPLKLDKNIF